MSDRGVVTASPPATEAGENRDSRLIPVFFVCCVLFLLLAAALFLVTAAGSVLATRHILDFVLEVAQAWHSDASFASQVMPYIGVFVLAMTAPLRRTRTVFWVAMALLFLVCASYQTLVWLTGEDRWIRNVLINTDGFDRIDVLRAFFGAVRNGAVVLMASMLGLAVNKDAKN